MSAARTTRALAWLTAVLVTLDVVVSAQAVALWSETAVAVHGFPFIHGAVVGSAVMGALIVARYPRHPIGWLLSAVGTAGAVSLVTEAYAYWVQEADGPGLGLPGRCGGLAVDADRRPARDRRAGADVPPRAGRPAAVPSVAVRRLADRVRRPAVPGRRALGPTDELPV